MLSQGSPLSSICPPGSRVICALSRPSAMMLPVLFLRLPAEAFDQLPQNKFDAARPGIRNRFARIPVDADFFVLGADAPTAREAFPASWKVSFELVLFFND